MIGVLLIQLFWASFIVIGLGLLLAFRRSWLSRYTEISVLITLFVAFLAGVGVFVVPVVAAYIFELPISWLAVLYVGLLVGSIALIGSQAVFVVRLFYKRTLRPSSQRLVLYGLVLAALVFDYAISLWTGETFSGDAPLHLAKIQLFLNSGHLTLADPFVGYSGILDLRYSTNIFYALEAMGAGLLHITALKFWFYSYAFYRLLAWLSLFTLAKIFLPKSTPREWPYIILMLCPFIYNGYFFSNAELPHAIALVWVSAFLVGLKLLLETNSKFLVILAALLIATTHALASLQVIGFLGLLIAILAVSKKISRQQLVTLTVAIGLLAIPVAANALSPSRSTATADTQKTAYGLHGVGLEGRKLGPLVVSLPRLSTTAAQYSPLDLTSLVLGALLIPYVFVLKRLQRPAVKLLVLILFLVVALEAFNVVYASMFGSAYLIYKVKNKQLKVLILLATVYYALLAYNPLVLTLTQGKIPLWFIARFQDFNTLAYITPIIGLLAAYEGLVRYIQIPKRLGNYYLLLVVLVVSLLVFPGHPFPISTTLVRTFNRQNHIQNTADYNAIARLKQFSQVADNQVIYTNDPEIINFLGSVTTSRQLGLVENQQSNQAQNLDRRAKCQQTIFQGLGLADLRAARVTTVILIPGDSDGYTTYNDVFQFSNNLQPYNLAGKLSYLKFEKQIGPDRVYAVTGQAKPQAMAASVCVIPYKQ